MLTLLRYLHDKRVEGVEASADKADMITHVLQLWDSSAAAASSSSSSHAALALLGMGSNSCPHAGEEDSLPEAPAPSRNTSYSSLCSLDLHTSAVSGVAPILNHLSRTMSAGGGGTHSSHPPSLALILNRVHASSSSLNSLNNHSEDALHGPPSSSCSGGLSAANLASSAPAAATTLADGIKRSESNWSFMDDQDSGDNLLQLSQPSAQGQAGLQQSSDSGCHSASSLSPAPAPAVFGSAPSNASAGAMGGIDAPGGMMLSTDSPSMSMRQSAVAAPSFSPAAAAASAQTQEMADTFVKWFYELLNAAAACETVKTSNFKSEHFFPDASAHICLQSGDQSEPPQLVQIENNGGEVCSALHDVTRRYGLTYNPNLCQDGVRGVMDPHGLVVVTACGTLHNAATCCGTFHQVGKTHLLIYLNFLD